jgi:cyanophycin synthetase
VNEIKLGNFSHGIPTAKGVLLTAEDNFSDVAQLQFPVVAKPTSDRHGVGVVTGLKNLEEVQSYWSNAGRRPTLVEEQLVGTEYRIVCVDYQFVAAAFRKAAHVVGDGHSSIAQLIEVKNQHPWRKKGHKGNLTLIEVDEIVQANLQKQHLTLESIPAPQQEVLLRTTANLSTGGEAWDVSHEVCPENVQLFERIARVCDLNIIGIDVMCTTLRQPIVAQPHTGVIEINASPGLRMHHYPIQGEVINVAERILRMTIAHTQKLQQ